MEAGRVFFSRTRERPVRVFLSPYPAWRGSERARISDWLEREFRDEGHADLAAACGKEVSCAKEYHQTIRDICPPDPTT